MAAKSLPVSRMTPPSIRRTTSSPAPKLRDSDNSAHEARPYQLELLDAAIDENTIVNLGTGAGKTFIAVMLIKELCSSIVLPFEEEEAKRTVFLVTTVPLVEQQASYIATHTCFRVRGYIGDMGVDGWSTSRWLIEFKEHQVLVMTMTIFKTLVLTNILPLKKVNLLIFDECHHAVKNHDYVKIMRLFRPHLDNGDEVPRVLGLTASLIPSKCHPHEIKDKIGELEKILCCRSQTATDLLQVARHATDPTEEVIYYDSIDQDIASLMGILQGCVDFLERFKKKNKDGEIYGLVKLYLDDLLHLLENLGIWCAHVFAEEGLRAIENEIQECEKYITEWEKSLLYLGRTRLKMFLQESTTKLEAAQHKRGYLTTHKVKQLTHYLGDMAVVSGDFNALNSGAALKKESNKLLGIVFVERRTTAAMLTTLLEHLKETEPNMSHIQCDYVVGHNEGKKGTYLRQEAKMNVKKQRLVLDKFRKEKINLLISTSVVEEGVDVPRCNTVVRFDFPQNLRAFIQSKGRARAKVSKYVLLISKAERMKQESDLFNYRCLEKELKSICQDRHVPDEEEILARMEELISPYMPSGRDGPKATLGSSLSLVHKYCQKLPKDHYTLHVPHFTTRKIKEADEDEEVLFQSKVTLPMNCPLREPIEGVPIPKSRRIAERSAALETIKLLHQEGELDDHLRPLTKDEDSDLEDEEKMTAKGVHNAGTEKRNDYYPNRVASSLTGCFPVPATGSHLYIFLIRVVDDRASLYQYLGPPASTFGIMTNKPIPHIKVPKFSLYERDQKLTVEVHKYHSEVTLSQGELDLLKRCHDALFTELLKITGSWLYLTFDKAEKDYLVVPLSILPDEQPLEAFLNMEAAEAIIRLRTPEGVPFALSDPKKAWPLPLESFHNALVTDIHLPVEKRKLYKVKKVDKKTTLQSPFPDPAAAPTYGEYFQRKYSYPFTDSNQPALVCQAFRLREDRLKLLRSRFKKNTGEDLVKREYTNEVNLFPEACSLYPVPTTVWKLARCLPSILWRLECALSVEDFRLKVAHETGIGLLGENTELTTETFLSGYEDHGFGELMTQQFTTECAKVSRQPVSSPDITALTKRGPDNALLLQAFTPKGANDSIDLERLETLGDSFLKLSTSVFLFHDRIAAHEGRLSLARSRRVGNLNLYYLAKKDSKRITEHIFSTTFEPQQMWIPPCFSFHEESIGPSSSNESELRARHYLRHKVTDKGVADCVESLIGAYLVSGGIDAALKFMKWVGIKIEPEATLTGLQEMESISTKSSSESGELSASSDSSSSSLTPPAPKKHADMSLMFSSLAVFPKRQLIEPDKLPLFVRCSAAIFRKHFPPQPKPALSDQQKAQIEKHLASSHGSNDRLKKFFKCIKDRSLLLQALTHASYTKNRVTDCYQRLEFLGDAVLDYLVTCHIYSTFPKYTPGEISNMRTALVNNNTFAELAVQLELHKAVLHLSPSLFSQIGAYVAMLTDMRSEEKEEILVTTQHEEATGSSTACANIVADLQATLVQDENDVDELDPPKVLGDVLESVAGAIFVDSGCSLESVWTVFKSLFEQRIASFKGKVPTMPVQELFEREPTLVARKSKDGKGMYRCTISFPGEHGALRTFTARSKTFKGARMAAAKAALRVMDK